MKILVTVLMTALFVFALATTWVDIVQPNLDRIAGAKSEQTTVVDSPPVKKRTRKVVPSEPKLLPVPSPEQLASRSEPATKIGSTSPEAISIELEEKMEEVRSQESRLAARQEALRMIYDDIRAELAAADDQRKRSRDETLLAESQPVTPAKTSRAASTKSTGRLANTDLSSRSQAAIIRNLVSEGKQETAISVLKSMKARDAAAILAALSAIDEKLADRLATGAQSDPPVRR